MKERGSSVICVKEHIARSGVTLIIALGLSMMLAFSVYGLTEGGKERVSKTAIQEVDVKNFGKVDNRMYRGGQPEAGEYDELAAFGIKTIIDLREDAKDNARALSKKAGMSYINIRLNSKRPPSIEESNLFLSLVNDQTNWPVFVHCAGGRHRTGVLIAIYRMEVYGWDARKAYDEMKDYKFYSSFGHGEMKDYVFDYYRGLLVRRVQPSTVTRVRRVADQGQ